MSSTIDVSVIEDLYVELVSGSRSFSSAEMTIARQVTEKINQSNDKTASVQYAIVYAMALIARSSLGGSANHRLSVAVGRYVAGKFNFELALEADDPLFRELHNEFTDVGARFPSWLAGRLTQVTSSTGIQDRQLGLPGFNYRMPESVTLNVEMSRPKVYIASALTRLNAGDLSKIEAQSEIAAAAYSKFGYVVHQPTFHTHPQRTQELSHAEVHSIDYGHVANSDVLVLLGEYPSFGAGKELAWADSFQLTVVIVSPPQVRVSRLLTGSPGTVLKPVEFADEVELSALLDKVARRGLARAKLHMEGRFYRESRYLKVWKDLRRRVLASDPRCFITFRELITPERIKEIIQSPTHFSGATVEELFAIKRCLNQDASQLDGQIDGGIYLTRANLDWLLIAQDIGGWTIEDCYALVRLAEEQLRLQGVRRLTFNSASDWEAFKESCGV